ncbi:MAG: hypothetical protein ACYDGM_10370 [Vulcanimicrobiaceae bacterium]
MTIVMRRLMLFFAVLALLPVAVQALLVQQRDQIGVTIVINVAAPLAMYAHPSSGSVPQFDGTIALAVPGKKTRFHAESLHFEATRMLIAQTNQKAVKVEAEVSPNPLATLLYSDQSVVTINVPAGQSIKVPCAYHVTVDTTKTYWQLKDGLGTDFDGSTFPGGDLWRDNYLSTPHPTESPYAVYADDGGYWTAVDTNGLMKTYCVDLTANVPLGVPVGTYSSNAIYTVYY